MSYWWTEETADGTVELIIGNGDLAKLHLRCDPFGVWRGKWPTFEEYPIDLIPLDQAPEASSTPAGIIQTPANCSGTPASATMTQSTESIRRANSMQRDHATVLILTPIKNAAEFLDDYLSALAKLSYAPHNLSLGFLESDSTDGTFELLQERLPELQAKYAGQRSGNTTTDLRFHKLCALGRGNPVAQTHRARQISESPVNVGSEGRRVGVVD